MELNEILSKVDHTLLAQTATWAEIKAICDDGMKYHTASVCIPASYVKQARDYVGDKLPICTVIGFPNGYDTTKAKCLEALDAVQNGADEVDMVINIGWVKDQRWNDLLEEIKAVKQHCEGKLLKVIIETCLLTDDEKIKMCEIVSDSGADYIKTSTGFSTGGATREDDAPSACRKSSGCASLFRPDTPIPALCAVPRSYGICLTGGLHGTANTTRNRQQNHGQGRRGLHESNRDTCHQRWESEGSQPEWEGDGRRPLRRRGCGPPHFLTWSLPPF